MVENRTHTFNDDKLDYILRLKFNCHVIPTMDILLDCISELNDK